MDKQRCRCCSTTKSDHYFDLFQKCKTSRTYAENIHNIAEVDVEVCDELPQFACGDCFSELQNIIEFALIIRQTDDNLRMELQQQRHTSVDGKLVESDHVFEEDCVAADEDQEDMQVCILEEEVLDVEETLHQQAEMTIVEEYVKDENVEDLQMVEEILEFDEEVPNDSIEHILPKENDPLQELAQVAATQENVHVDQTQDPDSHQECYYTEDECDDEYLIEYNPADESHCGFKPPKWKCVECKIILRGDVSYEGHMNIHKKIRPHKCPQCRCQFRCRKSLKKHKQTRHSNAFPAHNTKIEEITIVQMKCLDCNVECQTEIDLLKHELIAHNKHSHTTSCPLCPDVIVDNLLNHIQSVHMDRSSHPYDEVTETLLEPSPSSAITFLHCGICSKAYSSKSALNDHRKLCHAETMLEPSPSSARTFLHCGICSKAYSSQTALNDHRKLCHVLDEPVATVIDEYDCYVNMLDSIAQCEICKKKLKRKNLNKHMTLHERKAKEAEEQQPKLLCAYCPREFKNSKTLKQHEKTHQGETADTVYVCGDCDRQYNSYYLLETHRKQAHKDREHVCSICGNAFKLKNQLMNHMKLHLEKNIQCPHCDKKYARQFDLNVHLRSHTGELPFACHLCDKRFAIKVRLTYHLQKHFGVKHQCKWCHAEFNSKQKLKAHSFKHTGMPYRCELCDDHGFANRVVFKRHLNRVHHASMSDEALNEMFQRNTGKTIKIKQVIDPYMVPSPDDVEIEAEIVEESPVLISSSDTVVESEKNHA